MGCRAARGSHGAAATPTRAESAAPAGRSPSLARFPDLLGRPLARPVGRDEVVIGVILRGLRRLQLPEAFDLEPSLSQEPEHVSVGEMELDALVLGGPLEAVHPELRSHELLAHAALVRRAEHAENGVAEED